MVNNSYGARLSMLIGGKGLTQREFARIVGMSESSLSRCIKYNKIPKMKTLMNMTKVLNISLEELLYGIKSEDKINQELESINKFLETNASYITPEKKKQLMDTLNKEGD